MPRQGHAVLRRKFGVYRNADFISRFNTMKYVSTVARHKLERGKLAFLTLRRVARDQMKEWSQKLKAQRVHNGWSPEERRP